jgi:arylsulfatase
MAEVLRQNGFSTAASANITRPRPEISPPVHTIVGRRTQLEKFYGFIGETNQYAPLIYDGTCRLSCGRSTYTTDMTNQAISWMKFESFDARQAILHVLCPGATHAPIMCRLNGVHGAQGKFDQGWDKVRGDART